MHDLLFSIRNLAEPDRQSGIDRAAHRFDILSQRTRTPASERIDRAVSAALRSGSGRISEAITCSALPDRISQAASFP